MQLQQVQGNVFDIAVLAVVTGSSLQIIPEVAACLAILWYGLQIWESKTVRGWTNREKLNQPDQENNDAP